MVGYVFLSNNGIIALKQEVASGKLGRLLYLHFTRINLGPIRDDVDVIYDLASHDIAIASFLLGSWPSRASANAGHLLRRKNCDSAYISLTYPQDITAHIHVSWLDPHKVRRLTCIGDKKMATWDDLNPFEPVKIYDKGVIKERQYSDFAEFQLLPREGPSVSPWVQMVEPLKLQDQHFLDSINNRKCPLITDGEFGYKVTKVLQALESSVRDNGRSQQLRWK